VPLADVARLTIWFALVAGLVEVIVIAFRQRVLGDLVYRNPHFVWMAPAGLLAVFLAVAGIWWIFFGRRQANPPFHLLVFLSALAVFSIAGALHDIAVTLLAAGVTPHLARFLGAREKRFDAIVRRTLPAAVGVVTALAVFAFVSPAVRERMALRSLPAASQGAPDVLLLILDTVRGESLGLLGNSRRTSPELEELGAKGVVFERAIAPSPWTLPSHASIFTGRPPHELSANFNIPLDDTNPTLAEVLAAKGYATGGFVGNLFNVDYEHGVNRGFVRWEDYPVTVGQVAYNTALLRRFILDGPHGRQNSRILQALGLELRIGEKEADRINADALDWMDEIDDRPTFTFINYFDAHYPYIPRSYSWREDSLALAPRWSLRARISRAFARGPRRGLSPADEQELLDTYESEIAWLDARVGALLDSLDARGALDNTIVIVSSDHGEEFGEHGRYEHGNNVYMTQIHVPLVISFPKKVPAGVRVADPVALRHLPATILDLIGIDDSTALPGRSLAALWPNDTSGALPHPLSVLEKDGGMHASLVTPRLHYLYADGTELLYDYRADPRERRNLIEERWAHDTVRRFRAELARRLAQRAPKALLQRLSPNEGGGNADGSR
jgi:arylsulfatase A-like enzyme